MNIPEIGFKEIMTALGLGVAFFYRKAIGSFVSRSLDEDGDGKLEWSTEIRPLGYFFLICYMVYKEGSVVGEVYSDTWIIFISAGALGVEAVTAILKYHKTKINANSQSLPDEP